MKTTSLKLLLLFLSSGIYASQLNWVDEQIEAIKPPRKGVEIVKREDPFIFLQKNRPEKKEAAGAATQHPLASLKTSATAEEKKIEVKKRVFNLSAIMNASALIDGIWYKKNDKIEGYTVVDITKTNVTLKKSDKMVVLSTSTKTPTIKFKNK